MSEHQFNTQWFKGLPAEDVEALKQNIISAQKVLDKVREIVYNTGIAENDVRSQDYDTPSWAYRQAHRNGYLEALRWVDRLLTIESSNVKT